MTEKELFRQIASNLTKEHCSRRTIENTEEIKAVFATNLQSCFKVWQAFEKYIND